MKRMASEVGAGDAGGQPESDFSPFRFLSCRMAERRVERRAIFTPEVELVPQGERIDHAEQDAGSRSFRIQRREDGISIDQIVLSPVTYLTTSPGKTKDDDRILPPTR